MNASVAFFDGALVFGDKERKYIEVYALGPHQHVAVNALRTVWWTALADVAPYIAPLTKGGSCAKVLRQAKAR